jgi:hypothetical protein
MCKEATMAKLKQTKVADEGNLYTNVRWWLQEYPLARLLRDSRLGLLVVELQRF